MDGPGITTPPLPRAAYADVLPTKLVPPRIPPSYVVRPRLHDQLQDGTSRALTVVSAGAGWGKTLATAHWATTGVPPGPIGWVSLDPADDEPGRFWTCVVTALRVAVPFPADHPLTSLMPGLGGADEGFRRVLSELATLPTPVVLVLDDFQFITDPVVLEQLDALLRHPVPALRLVVLTRTDPPISLHRLRVAEELAEIRSRDLAFTDDEAAALLAAHRMPVAAADASSLVERTEGWPAGLRLAALFLRRPGAGHSVQDFAGADRAVATYLGEEVLASLPVEDQEFLLRTSVVERLTAELAAVLSEQEHCQRRLEDLEESNAFVIGLGSGRDWFRYHALLREMLQHRLRVVAPELVPELHSKAARWYAAHGQPLEALRHAADAEDWPLLGELFVNQAAPLLVSAERNQLGQVLARIPTDHQPTTADLAMCAAARLYLVGRFADMRPCLALADDLLAAASPGGHDRASRLALVLLSTVVARADGDITALLAATTEALHLLAGLTGEVPAAEAYRAVALGNHGTGLLWSGDVSSARDCLLDALTAADGAALEVTRVNVLSHLALAAAALGSPGEGHAYADRAIGVVQARGWSPLPQVATAYLAVAMIHLQRHELDDAETAIERGLVAGYSEPATRWALVLAGARLALSAGRVGDARDRLALARAEHVDPTPPFLARWLAITEAEVALASGRAVEAAEQLSLSLRDRQPPYVQEQCLLARAALAVGDAHAADEVLRPLRQDQDGPAATDVPVWLLTSLAADRLREDSRAIDALGRAVAAAGPDRIYRPFTASGPEQLERMLLRLQELRPELTGTVEALLVLLGRGGPESAAAALADPLTDRELSVLQFLPTMMTNGEIAADLFVSVNTVKAHLKRIFLKLDVTSKRQAVQRARELGLLPGGPS
jgi:LuxR family maltose regulon positive regulatory protein